MEFYRRFYTFILTRRYQIHFKGLELLKSKSPKLILPNHVSHIDPQLMTVIIYKYTDFVPIVAERFFPIPVIKYFLRKLDAIKVYEPKNVRKDLGLLEKINKQVLAALENDKSALIFPSGQLSEGGLERIQNKQSAYSIASKLPPKAKLIGVRIRGLNGSMWSKAWNGTRPDFFKTYLLSILLIFFNLIFLCPKRKVSIEFVDITEQACLEAKKGRKEFNSCLEDFYNAPGAEQAQYIRHFFFFPRIIFFQIIIHKRCVYPCRGETITSDTVIKVIPGYGKSH